MILKNLGNLFDFRLTGKISKRIAFSWAFFLFCSDTFWSFFYWGSVDRGYTIFQHIACTHLHSYSALSLILLTLHLFNPVSIIFRASLICISGNIASVFALNLYPVVSGIHLTQIEFYYLLIFSNVVGLFYYWLPLYWQWIGELERKSFNSQSRSDTILYNFIAGLDLTGKITPIITLNWVKFYLFLGCLGGFNGWIIYRYFTFYQHLIFNYCVIYSALLSILTSLYLFNPQRILIRLFIIIGIGNIGMTVGILVASRISGIPINNATFGGLHFYYSIIGLLCFGLIFYWQWRMNSNKNLNNEIIKRLKLQKEVEENRLFALQAQVEPEFLFQTLSNIQELLLTDPEKGKAMQLSLIQYLRASLSKINIGASPITQQMDMLKAFHEINKPKMQSNIYFNVEVPKDLEDRKFPPMLVQPLFENAVNQRIKDEIKGGEVSIKIEEKNNILRLIFKDKADIETTDRTRNLPFSGIEERLKTLFGSDGKLLVNENRTGGLEAVIEVPQSI